MNNSVQLHSDHQAGLTPGKFISGIFFLFLCLSLILIFDSASAMQLTDQHQRPELKFERIYEGLANSRITTIYQDHMGYIWVGTPSGLHRYDGINFHIYTSSQEPNSIISYYVGDIFEDSKNNLWIGTGGGLNRYNIDTEDFTRFGFYGGTLYNPETSGSVNAILEDSDGEIWVAGGEESLYRLDIDEGVLMPVGDFGDTAIGSFFKGENHTIWLATSTNGIVQYSTKEDRIIQQFTHNPADPKSILTNSIQDILQDYQGDIWAATLGQGLIRIELDGKEPVIRTYRHQSRNPNSLGNNYIFELYEDRDGQLWVGNENGGLHLYNRDEDLFYHYRNDPRDPFSITDDSIWSVFQDRDDRLWVGTAQTGINLYDPHAEKFTSFKMEMSRDAITSQVIRDLIVDENGDIWLATDGGGIVFYSIHDDLFTAYQHDPDDPYTIGTDAGIHLNLDEEGRIWVGSFRGGLDILTDREQGRFVTFTEFMNHSGYIFENVFATHIDRVHDYIWVADFENWLYRYELSTGELIQYPVATENSAFEFVVYILEDSNHNLWLATLEGVIQIPHDRKSGGEVKHFVFRSDDPATLRSNTINHIAEDSNQNIWIGTTGGLSRYVEESESFVTYSSEDGLPSNDIRSILEDDNGHLWIGTNLGLSHFDPDNLTFKNYNRRDGLQGNEFSRYSAHKMSGGELLFGGMNGFNMFHPDNVRDNPTIPAVYLTDFRFMNRPVEIGGEDSPLSRHISVTDTLAISYSRQNILTFEFVALNYTRSENNQYAYMMDGFESDWNYVGNQRYATYTNLNPGEYLFRVKASNNDGVWNEEGVALTLIITPPFWQTSWFFLLSALLISGIVIIVYRTRVRKIRKRNIELEREVMDRTSQLKEKNIALQEMLKELDKTKDNLVLQAHKAGMADIVTGVLHNVGNILTSINTSAGLIGDTAKESKISGLVQANLLLREHIGELDEFITKNPKGKGLMEYYLKLEKPITEEREQILRQTERLVEKIKLVNDVIAAQQNYAGIGLMSEEVSLPEVIDNAISLESGSIERHGLNVTTDYRATDTVVVQQTKLIHVLVNIFRNAKEAMTNNAFDDKNVEIKTWQEGDNIFLSISDNGMGIDAEHMNKIFTQGFTTKRSGHGFGLHSTAIYMKEIGGSIRVSSEGVGKGTTFVLSFPNKPESET